MRTGSRWLAAPIGSQPIPPARRPRSWHSAIQISQECRIHTDAWPDRVYDGVVSRLMPIADRAKAAVPVRVKVSIPADEEGMYLKPEMGAIVTFLNDKPAE
jgi:hypothetical protein